MPCSLSLVSTMYLLPSYMDALLFMFVLCDYLPFVFPADYLKFWLLVTSRKILSFGFYPQLLPFYCLFFVL